MTVTFSRAQLVKVAETALAEHEKAQAVYADACDAYRTRALARHHEKYREPVRKLRDYLTKAIKQGGPIDRNDVRRAIGGVGDIEYLFHTGVADYDVRNNVEKPTGLLSPAELAETRALLSVLNAATGETVSANELKLLGLKNLTPVFIAAGASPTPAAKNAANRARR